MVAVRKDLRVDEDPRFLDRLALRIVGILRLLQVHDEQALRYANLDGGKADPRRLAFEEPHQHLELPVGIVEKAGTAFDRFNELRLKAIMRLRALGASSRRPS